METQKFKSVDLRTIVDCALSGRPINVRSVTLFDAPDADIDDPRDIVSPDFDDPLEVIQRQRELFEEKQLNRKEVSTNETQKDEKAEDEETPPLSQE